MPDMLINFLSFRVVTSVVTEIIAIIACIGITMYGLIVWYREERKKNKKGRR